MVEGFSWSDVGIVIHDHLEESPVLLATERNDLDFDGLGHSVPDPASLPRKNPEFTHSMQLL